MPITDSHFSKQVVSAVNEENQNAIDSLLDQCVDNPRLERALSKAGPALADVLVLTAESGSNDRFNCVIRAAQHNNLGEVLIDKLTAEAKSLLRAGQDKAALSRLSVVYQMVAIPDCYHPLCDASDRACEALREIFQEHPGEVGQLATELLVDIECARKYG